MYAVPERCAESYTEMTTQWITAAPRKRVSEDAMIHLHLLDGGVQSMTTVKCVLGDERRYFISIGQVTKKSAEGFYVLSSLVSRTTDLPKRRVRVTWKSRHSR